MYCWRGRAAVVVAVVVLQVVDAPGGERPRVLRSRGRGCPGSRRRSRCRRPRRCRASGPCECTYAAVPEMPSGNLPKSGCRLPAASRLCCIQQSSMFTYWYPAAGQPGRHDLVGGLLDQRLGHVAAVGVPVVPAHRRGQREAVRQCLGRHSRADAEDPDRCGGSQYRRDRTGQPATSAAGCAICTLAVNAHCIFLSLLRTCSKHRTVTACRESAGVRYRCGTTTGCLPTSSHSWLVTAA